LSCCLCRKFGSLVEFMEGQGCCDGWVVYVNVWWVWQLCNEVEGVVLELEKGGRIRVTVVFVGCVCW